MPFNSYPYFVFLLLAVLGFRLLEKSAPTGRRVFLLLASYAFYAWWRADFLLLLYPYQIYDATTKSLRKEIQLDGGLPPTFIAQMGDDTGSLPQGSTLLYLELINRKIPAELHIYQRGGHGFGMRARPNSTGPTDWTHRATDWLKQGGLVK